MEMSAEASTEDHRRLDPFFQQGGLGASLSADPTKRPAERIAVALRKTYIVTMVVSMAGYAGLVHNRMTNGAYQQADFEEAMVDANAQITMLVTRAQSGGGLSLGLSQNGVEDVAGDGTKPFFDVVNGATVLDWFDENAIEGRTIDRILGAHEWQGEDLADLPTPLEIKDLILEAQAAADVPLETAAEAVEEGLSIHIWALSMCDRSPSTPCRVTVVPVSDERDAVLVMDAHDGTLEVAPGMSRLDEDENVTERLPSALR